MPARPWGVPRLQANITSNLCFFSKNNLGNTNSNSNLQKVEIPLFLLVPVASIYGKSLKCTRQECDIRPIESLEY